MVRAQVCAVFGFVMLVATSTEARELELSVENRIGGDNNIFGVSRDQTEDGFYEFAPKLVVREEREEVDYNVRYVPVYQAFFDHDNANGWDHLTDGELDWRITPRDTLGVSQRFSDTRRVRLEATEAAAGLPPVLEENDRERVRRIHAAVYYSRQFTPTLAARVSFQFEDVDFDSLRQTDTRAYSGSLAGNYGVSAWTTLGLSGSGRFRENRGSSRQSSSSAIIGNVGLSLASQLTETVDVFLQAGPSFIRSDEDDFGAITSSLYSIDEDSGLAKAIDNPPLGPASICDFQGTDFLVICPELPYTNLPSDKDDTHSLLAPADASGEQDTDISFFAEARLTKRWRKALLRLSYRRTESASNGVGSSSIVDSANVFFSFNPEQPWRFVFLGQWSQQQVVSDVRQSLITVQASTTMLQGAPPLFFAETNGQAIVVTESANDSDLTQWKAIFRVERQLTKQLTLLGRFTYFHEKQEHANSSEESNSYYVGFVGLRYAFDPVIF